VAADPLDREHPDADHDEKPTTAGQQVIAIDTKHGGGSGQPGGDHAWQQTGNRNG
jgi:hypothetical protein